MDILLMQENMRRISELGKHDGDLAKLYRRTEKILQYLRTHGDSARFRAVVDPQGLWKNASSQEIEAGLESALERIKNSVLNLVHGIKNAIGDIRRTFSSADRVEYGKRTIDIIMRGEPMSDEWIKALIGNRNAQMMWCTPPQIRDKRIAQLNQIVSLGISLAKNLATGKLNQENLRKSISRLIDQGEFGDAQLSVSGKYTSLSINKYMDICNSDPTAAAKMGHSVRDICASAKKIFETYLRMPVDKYYEASEMAVKKLTQIVDESGAENAKIELMFLKNLGDFIRDAYCEGMRYDFGHLIDALSFVDGMKSDIFHYIGAKIRGEDVKF